MAGNQNDLITITAGELMDRQFLPRHTVVLYLTLEDTDARIQERLARMFGTDWDGVKLHLTFRTTLSGNDLIQQLENFVFDHPETRLIVIDTL